MIRVLLADDQQLVRSGLAMLINSQPDLEVVGQAADGAQALAEVERLAAGSAPDVVLMDVRMPVMDGIEATGHIISAHPEVKIIMLTTFDIDDYVYAAVQQGANGFLLKDAPPEELLGAIRTVYRGDAVIAPSATKRLLERFIPAAGSAQQADSGQDGGEPRPHQAKIDALTAREHELLLLIAQGLSNGEMTQRLFLSEATVKTHVSHILAKLGARDRVQAVIIAYEAGLMG
ncbi:MAG: response regulator transcription factor [Rothia sp. (in: high G+C Gram-positive bacteria)]|nr:response regulator transcription factor [Rothia sp. (in: high G+C Gram-positive bacteria)]